MTDPLVPPLAYAALTAAVYCAAVAVRRKTNLVLLHPVLTSVVFLIVFLSAAGIPYPDYKRGTEAITMLLGPAVVALAVPLCRRMDLIVRQGPAILVTTVFGSLVGILSSVLPAVLLGTPWEAALSLAPKSVTTPIAMDIAEKIGGVPSFASAVVILTGIFGAALGPVVLRLVGVTNSAAFGLAMGFSAHGIGTARAAEIGDEEAAFSGLGLCLNGLATAVLAPPVVGGIARLCL